MTTPGTASTAAPLLAAYRTVAELAGTHAPALDTAARTMAVSAWVGGGAPRFGDELMERRRRLQKAFEQALTEIADLIARRGENPPRPPRLFSPIEVAAASRGAFAGMDVEAMERLAAELDRAGHALPEAGSRLNAECSAVCVAAAAGRTVGEAGTWAAAQAGDLRKRMEVIKRTGPDPFAGGAGGKGADLAAAGLVGYGLFGAFAPDGNGAGSLLAQARTGDTKSLGKVLELQRQGKDADLAGRVSAWWRMLDPAARQGLINKAPGVVGFLNGIPSATRDSANRAFLALEEKRLRDERAELLKKRDELSRQPGRFMGFGAGSVFGPKLAEYSTMLARVEAVKAALAEGGRNGRPPALLLGFDTTGQGRAVVSYGDPDTAHHVTTYVPGLATKIEDGKADFERALFTWDRANGLDSGKRTASIAWLGYDAPQIDQAFTPGHTVLFRGAAENGAKELASFVDGLRASHDPDVPANLTMVGHSYGSLTTGQAAVRRPFGKLADDLVFVGSPGLGVDHARDLGVDPAHVWVGAAPDDFVAEAGWFGESPYAPKFGAKSFVVDPGGHSAYWYDKSESLRNISSVVVGKYEAVQVSPTPDLALQRYLQQPVPSE
ncbi:alpha/beta hydrolase [Streptosporangium sp. NPDC051022]|uniref:alpha/beta hydrolase n=1 Tax=Streptosporangium sp. NPDC051022 TaxID=3155752 RepID=UPI0034381918